MLAGRVRGRLAEDLWAHTVAGIDRVIAETPTVWEGQTADVFVGLLAGVRPDAVALGRASASDADVLGRYAAEVADIQESDRLLATRAEEVESRLRGARADWADASGAWAEVFPTASIVPGSELEQALARERLAEVEAEAAVLERERDVLVERREAADRRCVAGLSDPAQGGDVGRVLATAVPSTGSVLGMLSGLSASELLAVLEARPGLVERLRAENPDAVHEWWSGLDRSAQHALALGVPNVIGGLGGVSYWARDRANRILLDRAITDARTAPEQVGRLTALEEIRDALKPRRGVVRQLTVFENGDRPLAAVSVGDLDQAVNVTYSVPGMNTRGADMQLWARGAQNLYDEQGLVGGPSARAVVAWIGYETPTEVTVGSGDLARAGGDRLVDELEGFNATRNGRDVELHVVGHSYGTTTAANALSAKDLGVASFTMLGSAGIEPSIGGADGLHAGQVFAGQAQNVFPVIEAGKGDEWAHVGRRVSGRDNPMEPGFGATSFGVDGEPDKDLHQVTAHDPLMPYGAENGWGYLDKDTESLQNTALTSTGQPERLTGYAWPGLTQVQEGLIYGPPSFGSPTEGTR